MRPSVRWAAILGAAVLAAVPVPGWTQSASEIMQKQRERHRLRDE